MNQRITKTVTTRAYARAGLIGNPSDGFNGKTISVIVRNFWAEVSLQPAERLTIELQPGEDNAFDSIDHLTQTVSDQGYYGGTRLLKAAIKRFREFTADQTLHGQNFSIGFTTNIPRQVGLAGSSAIVTAALRGLMKWYDVDIESHLLASLTLSAESELGIPAGLQDRVIQAYEGVVYMDFDRDVMQSDRGLVFGKYESLNAQLLPNLYIAYAENAGEPTEIIHNNLRQRYNENDLQVVDAMKQFGELARQAKDAMIAGDSEKVHSLIDQNFDLRRSICKLQPDHSKMVDVARSVGASGKNCGSGGAIIGTYEDEKMYENLETEMNKIGCVVIKPIIQA